jgi:hypothetical protein
MGLVLKNVNITGGKLSSTVDAPKGWVRNPEWLPIPEIATGEQVVYFLMAIFDSDYQSIAFKFQGAYTVDWGDGTVTNHTSFSTAEHTYDYPTLTSLVTSFGYKQAMIKVTPQTANNLTRLSFDMFQTGHGYSKFCNILDMVLNVPNMTIVSLFGETFQLAPMCERVWFKEVGTLISAYRIFAYMDRLQEIPVFDVSSLTDVSLWFYRSRALKTIGEFDFSSATNINSMCYQCASLTNFNATIAPQYAAQVFPYTAIQSLPNIDFVNCIGFGSFFEGAYGLSRFVNVDTSLVPNISYSFYAIQSLQEVEIDCTSVTSTVAAFSFTGNLTKILLHNLTVGVDVSSKKLSKDAIDALFTSLGTASGSQTIIVTGNPGAATCDTTIATGKGFTVTI